MSPHVKHDIDFVQTAGRPVMAGPKLSPSSQMARVPAGEYRAAHHHSRGENMATEFQVSGNNASAPFTLKIHRGEGMALLAMNWRRGTPPLDFVGFAIQYREPGGTRFFTLKNRLAFASSASPASPAPPSPVQLSTLVSPIQSFRWVHFPFNAEMPGAFVYRVTPVFMNPRDELSHGPAQEVAIELRRETFPGLLNVSFTRGFVSSQAFVDHFANADGIRTLLPETADQGLAFKPTHPQAARALAWMGFEARSVLLELLDQAVSDSSAQVRVVAYDLSEPEVVKRLESLGARLQIIIDDDGPHGKAGSGETQSALRLAASAGDANVQRQHMGKLQHNKFIVVNGRAVHKVLCGSTNFSWRGLYVQANNAVVLQGRKAVRLYTAAFESYRANGTVAGFSGSASATWQALGLKGIDAQVAFSPHNTGNAVLAGIGQDIASTTSSLFYSLAFLAQTPGVVKDAITRVSRSSSFVYGMADREVGGIVLNTPDGNVAPVSPAALTKNVPLPFKAEPTGGGGVRLHHKFVVIDFDKPGARVYMGSYNFSVAADRSNGENLLLIRNRRVAVAYMVEALRLFDHYRFRVKQATATRARTELTLRKPPRAPGEKPWWDRHYSEPHKVRDRLLFSA